MLKMLSLYTQIFFAIVSLKSTGTKILLALNSIRESNFHWMRRDFVGQMWIL
jgi:hypothetical protein